MQNSEKVPSFSFSVVINISTRAENYKTAFESIRDQSMSLESIQVVFADSKCDEESKCYINQLCSEYPANVLSLSLEGLSTQAARNAALPFLDGKYFTFMDSDESFTPNTLSSVKAFFNFNGKIAKMAVVPFALYGRPDKRHERFRQFPKCNLLITMVEHPHLFLDSCAGVFFEREYYSNLSFDETFGNAADADTMLSILEKNGLFGFVPSNHSALVAGSSAAGRLLLSGRHLEPGTREYINILDVFSRHFNRDDLLLYEREFIVYELRERLLTMSESDFEEEGSLQALKKQYGHWVSKLDNEFILRDSQVINGRSFIDLFLRLKGDSLAVHIDKYVPKNSFKVMRITLGKNIPLTIKRLCLKEFQKL